MIKPSPKFKKPPVVETVLSAQFQRLAAYRTAHAGCFWRKFLYPDWKAIEETVRIEDQFERFGDERIWGQLHALRFGVGSEPQRTQITRSDDARMMQIQDSRFVYNWKKSPELSYPSYEATKSEFSTHYSNLRQFLTEFEIGAIDENQWEITYVNHIPKGELWQSAADWRTIFPWMTFPAPVHSVAEGVMLEWRSVIGDNIGRLHTKLAYGRISAGGPEAIILELVARGPAGEKAGNNIEAGLKIGHECIVNSFTEMTSPIAHEYWQRSD